MRILYLPSYKAQQRQFEKKDYNPYPCRLAAEAEWYRRQGHHVYWINDSHPNMMMYDQSYYPNKIVREPEGLPFLSLPHPDRVSTRAKDYTSGNYKYLPGTHIMSASGCWHGACSFCVEKGKPYEVRPVDDVISEIEECKQLGFKSIFDDSATFPVGNWADSFCGGLIGDNNKVELGCNMRMVDADFRQMKAAGFRMLLFGLESANQATLDRINKGVKVEDYKYIIKAAKAGLDCHVATMVGYPWEDYEDTMRTINLVKWLLIKGYAKTAQMSFYTPPGNQPQGNEQYRKYVKRIYEVAYSPEFWFTKIKDIKNKDDLKYLWRQIKEGLKSKFY